MFVALGKSRAVGQFNAVELVSNSRAGE